MFKGHPWEGEIYGAVEARWYLRTNYMINVVFEVDYGPFIAFCKKEGVRSNDLLMKVASRLSEKYIPQYSVGMNCKLYPTRYAAGYIRTIAPGRDMVEWVAVREKENCFEERLPRDRLNTFAYFMITALPRLAFLLARTIFVHRETKDRFALLITRNPLRKLGREITFHGTGYPCYFLLIPFKGQTVFGYPHALGNMDYYENFLIDFIKYMEQPETIPREIVEKKYIAIPQKTAEEAEMIRKRAPWKPKKK